MSSVGARNALLSFVHVVTGAATLAIYSTHIITNGFVIFVVVADHFILTEMLKINSLPAVSLRGTKVERVRPFWTHFAVVVKWVVVGVQWAQYAIGVALDVAEGAIASIAPEFFGRSMCKVAT
jgi:quinol-cytochrome oxidoreductase complex cytochrome b subunit